MKKYALCSLVKDENGDVYNQIPRIYNTKEEAIWILKDDWKRKKTAEPLIKEKSGFTDKTKEKLVYCYDDGSMNIVNIFEVEVE